MSDMTKRVADEVLGCTTDDLRAMLDAETARRELAEKKCVELRQQLKGTQQARDNWKLSSENRLAERIEREAALVRGFEFLWAAYQSAVMDRGLLTGVSDEKVRADNAAIWKVLCSEGIVGFDPLEKKP
jgi:hypothetical protein